MMGNGSSSSRVDGDDGGPGQMLVDPSTCKSIALGTSTLDALVAFAQVQPR